MEKDDRFKLGYQSALQMGVAASQIIWSSFNSILAANALLLGLGGVILKIFQSQLVPVIISCLGLIICAAWFCVLKRHFAYQGYYFAVVREIEQSSLAPEIRTFRRGREFGHGAAVIVNHSEPWRMPWAGRIFRIETSDFVDRFSIRFVIYFSALANIHHNIPDQIFKLNHYRTGQSLALCGVGVQARHRVAAIELANAEAAHVGEVHCGTIEFGEPWREGSGSGWRGPADL